MGAMRSMAERGADEAGEAMEATSGALLECGCRYFDPVRKLKFWRKVGLPASDTSMGSLARSDQPRHLSGSWGGTF